MFWHFQFRPCIFQFCYITTCRLPKWNGLVIFVEGRESSNHQIRQCVWVMTPLRKHPSFHEQKENEWSSSCTRFSKSEILPDDILFIRSIFCKFIKYVSTSNYDFRFFIEKSKKIAQKVSSNFKTIQPFHTVLFHFFANYPRTLHFLWLPLELHLRNCNQILIFPTESELFAFWLRFLQANVRALQCKLHLAFSLMSDCCSFLQFCAEIFSSILCWNINSHMWVQIRSCFKLSHILIAIWLFFDRGYVMICICSLLLQNLFATKQSSFFNLW